MAYSDGEILIESLVKTATNYESLNVGRGTWDILNTGKSNTYAIIKPGAAGRNFSGHNTIDNRWVTVIQVWQMYTSDGNGLSNLEANVANLLAKIDAKPRLGDTTNTIADSNVFNVGEVMEMWNADGGLVWLRQDIFITWLEQTAVTFV
jgi:hypothetical protein